MYHTNKYSLICGAFVGMNNHLKKVVYWCCFLSNETTESLVWLFEVLKNCMGGVRPVSKYTDNYQAIVETYVINEININEQSTL